MRVKNLKYIIFILSLSYLHSMEFKVASYNVENLFDMQYNGTEYKEYIPNKHNWTQSILNQKLTNISEVICEIDADIIALQEIENRNALKLLQNSLKSFGCNYKYGAITHNKRTAIEVALLSKIPIQTHNDIVVSKKLKIRNILEVKFLIDNNPLYIFVNHWSSKRSLSNQSKRLASAEALSRRVNSLPNGSEYIILGDFNCNYNSYDIAYILKTVKKNGEMVRECNLNISTRYNLWLEEPIYKRWSYNFYGKKEGIDAIIIPYTLFNGRGIDYINNSFSIFKRDYLFHKRGYIFRWEYKKGRHRGVGYSDHLAISAKFSTNDYKKENCNIELGSIGELFQKTIHLPMMLKDVEVVSKFKNGLYIKDNSTDRKIAIFGIDKQLIVGKTYNMVVYKRILYNNRYEITDFSIIH